MALQENFNVCLSLHGTQTNALEKKRDLRDSINPETDIIITIEIIATTLDGLTHSSVS